MSGAGSGYDYATNVISPDGKVFQLEYAEKAVESSGTVVGVRCADGVILGVEKLMVSKMLVKSSNKRVQLVDEHVGIAAAGIAADARALTNFARQIAKKYRQNYGDPIPPAVLAQQLADVMYAYTSYGAYRPFGASAVIAGFDEEKKAHELYMCEVDGTFHRYFGTSVGKGARSVKTDIEKYKLSEKTVREALPLVATMLHTVHEKGKDKPIQLELGWICEESRWRFQSVPAELAASVDAEARERAEREVRRDEDGIAIRTFGSSAAASAAATAPAPAPAGGAAEGGGAPRGDAFLDDDGDADA